MSLMDDYRAALVKERETLAQDLGRFERGAVLYYAMERDAVSVDITQEAIGRLRQRIATLDNVLAKTDESSSSA